MVIVTGTVLAVAPLAMPAYKLIAKIIQEAETSSQNKEECSHLVERLSGLHKLLPGLQQRAPGWAEGLARLSDTLGVAYELVVDCQKWRVRRFTPAGVLAARFDKVNRRINAHLIDFTAYCQVADGTTVLLPLATTPASHSLTGL